MNDDDLLKDLAQIPSLKDQAASDLAAVPKAPPAPPVQQTISDYAKRFARGAASQLVTAPGQLMVRAGLQPVTRDLGLRLEKQATDAMSPAANAVDASSFLGEGGDVFGPYPVQKALSAITESAPGLIGLAASGRLAARPLQQAQVGERVTGAVAAAGAPKVIAKGVGEVAETAPYWIGEGLQAGGANAAQVGQQLRDAGQTPVDKMASTDAFQQAMRESLMANPGWTSQQHIDAVREGLAQRAESEAFDKTMLATSGIGAITGAGALGVLNRRLGGQDTGSFLRTVRRGAVEEALQEMPQSGGEQLIANYVARKYGDPEQSLLEGVGEAVALGGVAGVATGGGLAAGVYPFTRRRPDETPPGAAPEPMAPPPDPSGPLGAAVAAGQQSGAIPTNPIGGPTDEPPPGPPPTDPGGSPGGTDPRRGALSEAAQLAASVPAGTNVPETSALGRRIADATNRAAAAGATQEEIEAARAGQAPQPSPFEQRASWKSLPEVEAFLSQSRQQSPQAPVGKPVQRADGTFTFALPGEPEFDALEDARNAPAVRAERERQSEQNLQRVESLTRRLSQASQAAQKAREAGDEETAANADAVAGMLRDRLEVARRDVGPTQGAGDAGTGVGGVPGADLGTAVQPSDGRPGGAGDQAGRALAGGGDAAGDAGLPRPEGGDAAPQGLAAPAGDGGGARPVVLQNRDRSGVASVTQMQSIAANPDPRRLSFSRDFGSGAPVVFSNFDEARLVDAQLGREDTITDSQGRQYAIQYAVIEADEVVASNAADGTPNDLYEDSATPGLIRAVAGNGRMAGLQEAFRRGTAAGYAQGIAADTALHGIDPAVIDAMSNPVLVRIMRADDVTPDIGDRSNVSGAARLNPVEQARTDMARVNLEALDFTESGDPTPAAVKAFVAAMPEAERSELMTRDGAAGRQAIDRLMAATFAKAYGDERLVELYAQATDPDARNVLSAMAQAAGAMAKLEGMGDLDVRPLVIDAANMAVNAARNGVSLAKFVQTPDITLAPEVRPIAQMMAENARSARRMAESLRAFADLAYSEATKESADMFGEVPRRTRGQVIEEVFGGQGREGGAGTVQNAGRAGMDEAGAAGQGDAPGQREPAGDTGQPQGQGSDRPADGQDDAFGLTSYSLDELAQRDAELEQAQADQQAEQDRRASAPPADDFVLSGSDRPADQAAARGQMELGEAPVDAAAAQAATSPKNDTPEPTDAQKDAGNYKKGHVRIAGLDIAIENEAGTRRRPEWPPLAAHYGYVKRTEGADGDQVDVFIKPGTPEDFDGPVFVIDQHVDGKFDEHKVMLGWGAQPAAAKAYRDNYTKDWKGLNAIRRMSMDEFKAWLANGDTTAPAQDNPVESGFTAAESTGVPTFATYADAQAWIKERSAAAGGQRKFTTTDEYRQAYPQIKALYDAENATSAEAAMKRFTDAGMKIGDRVQMHIPGMFLGAGRKVTGTVIERGGRPVVKIDGEMDVASKGRIQTVKSIGWDSRWSALDPRNDKDAGYRVESPRKGYAVTQAKAVREAVLGVKGKNFDAKQVGALVKWISGRADSARIVANLKEHAGTPWARQSLEGALTRAAIEEYVAGRTPDFDSFLNAPTAVGLRTLLEQAGADGAWQYLAREGVVGNSSKPVNSVSSSFIDCNPSKDCATFCYAAKGNFAYGSSVRKSELMTWAAENDPVRLGRMMAGEYAATLEFQHQKALRLFDKGDGTDAWLPVIAELNRHVGPDGKPEPIRVQVFSKNPEFLRKVPEMNLRMLSVDKSNVEVARANPDLPVAFVYTDASQVEFLNEIKDRVQVILPVKQGVKLLEQSKIDELPKWTKPVVCPVDDGRVKIGKNRFKRTDSGSTLTTEKGEWNCTRCDKAGGVGCFHGSTTEKAIAAFTKPVHTQADEEVNRILDELRSVSGRLAPRERAELLGSLGRLVSAIRAGIDIGTEGTGRAGDAARTGADDGWQPIRITRRQDPGPGEEGLTAEAPRRKYRDEKQLSFDYELDPSQAGPAGEAARRAAAAAVVDLQSADSLLALALSRDFAARQRASLVGQQVASPDDLAVLAQVYRDPRFETLRTFFVDGEGKVVAQIGLTQRMPGSAKSIMGDDDIGYFRRLSDAARAQGAVRYFLLHNHPSGQAMPSSADQVMTAGWAKHFPDIEFAGHVVIDTNEYSVIDRNGQYQTKRRDFGQPGRFKEGEFAGVQVTGPETVMGIAKRLAVDERAVTLITATYQNVVTGVTTVPRSSITSNTERNRLILHRAALRNHAANVFAVSTDITALARLDGLVTDSVHVRPGGKVVSLAERGGTIGNLYSGVERVERLSPDTSPALRPMGELANRRFNVAKAIALLKKHGIVERQDIPGIFDTPKGILAPSEFADNGLDVPVAVIDAAWRLAELSRKEQSRGMDAGDSAFAREPGNGYVAAAQRTEREVARLEEAIAGLPKRGAVRIRRQYEGALENARQRLAEQRGLAARIARQSPDMAFLAQELSFQQDELIRQRERVAAETNPYRKRFEEKALRDLKVRVAVLRERFNEARRLPPAIGPAASRGGAPGMDAPRVTRLAAAIARTWVNGPEVVVVQDMQDMRIPEAVRREDAKQRSGGASGDPEGFFYGGKVYLVAGQLGTASDVVRVLSHEALGHYGLRGLYGGELGRILDQIANVRRADVAAKLQEYGLPDTVQGRRVAAEEVLAVMAQTNPQLGFVRRAVAAIRQWLRGLGMNLQMTDADIIAQFIIPARQWVMQGGKAGSGVPAFSRTPTRMTEEQARAAGFTMKAYRGVSKSAPFNASGTTWATTNRDVAQAYAEEVFGYDDAAVVTVMVKPDGLPQHDIRKMDEATLESLEPDEFGNPQAPGVYRNSDDHSLGNSVGSVTVIHAPNEAVAVIDGAGAQFSRRADVSPLGFYSELARKIEAGPGRADAANWKAYLRAQKGIKPDELEWSGVNEFLDLQQGKITKEAVREYLAASGVRVEEVTLSDATVRSLPDGFTLHDNGDGTWSVLDAKGDEVSEGESEQEAIANAQDESEYESTPGAPKFGTYTLPGGENYREVLLTLPIKEAGKVATMSRAELAAWYENEIGYNPVEDDPSITTEALREMVRGYDAENGAVRAPTVTNEFRSSHWDQPNVLAHVRLNDRTDADGKRVLFVEEIQSDWAQKGRKEGFYTPEAEDFTVEVKQVGSWHPQFPEVRDKWRVTVNGQDRGYIQAQDENEARYKATANEQNRRDNSGKAPLAPFVTKTDAWVALAIKRVVKMAVDEGYDRVAFVTGDQAADRFDLSKQISAVELLDNNSGGVALPSMEGPTTVARLVAYGRDGMQVIDRRVDSPGELEEYVGKEVAQRLLEAKPTSSTSSGMGVRKRRLAGLDLKVGGEGMKAFYDQIVPTVAKDVLKKLGGGPVTRSFNTGSAQAAEIGNFLASVGRAPEPVEVAGFNLAFDITPAMRDTVLEHGMPMFSRKPTVESVQAAVGQAANAIRGATLQGAWQKTVNAATDVKPIGLQFLGRRQIVDVYGNLLPQLTDYSNRMQQYDADKNESAAAADEVVRKWRRLPDADRLADVMHGATLAGYDPDASKTPPDMLTPEMREVYDGFTGLSPDAKALYREARDAYRAHWNAVKAAIGERIERADIAENDRRALMEKYRDQFLQPIEGVYFPLARFGDYVITAKDAEGNKVVAFAETMTQAQAEQARMQREYQDVSKITKRIEYNAARDSVSKEFVRQLFTTIDKSSVDGQQADLLKDAVNQLYLTSLPDVSWAKHGIHRKGVAGYSKDARRAFAANMFHGGYHLAKLRHADVLQDYLRDMQEHVEAQRTNAAYDSVTAQQVVDEMVKRHDATMNPDNNQLANTLTGLGFVWFLGMSPASAIVNLSQTALVAYPVIAARYGYGATADALTRASKETLQHRNDLRGKLTPDENGAVARAVREGLIDITQAHDLAGVAEGRDSGLQSKFSPVMRAASWMFHQAEKFNRQATFIAAYRLARGKGETSEAAYEIARYLTYKGHFDYAASNRPRAMMGPVARVTLLFKQYGQNMIYTLIRNALLAARGDREALKILSGILVGHGLAAGALGLPLASVLLGAASLIGTALGGDDEPWDAEVALRNYLADAFGPTAGEVLSRGVFRAFFPGDIASRVGLDSLLIRDIDLTLEPNKVWQELINAALGPVAGIGMNVSFGAADLARGDLLRGIQGMVPKAIGDGFKALRYWTDDGVKDRTGVDVLDDVTAADLVAQVTGFTPARVSEAYAGRRAIMDKKRAIDQRRESLLRDFSTSVIDKDGEKRLRALQEIQHFNSVNPTVPITSQSMLRSIQNRMRRQAEASSGVYLPRRQRDLEQEGRFANVN